MQFFVDFGTRTVLQDYFFDQPLDIFFLTFLFFVPSLKRRLILLFVSVFLLCHLLVSMLRCDYISSFSYHKFFFVFLQIRHSGFGRLYQSSDALVGGIVGIRLTPSFVIIIFFGNSFFPMTQRKIISLSLFRLPTWQDNQPLKFI